MYILNRYVLYSSALTNLCSVPSPCHQITLNFVTSCTSYGSILDFVSHSISFDYSRKNCVRGVIFSYSCFFSVRRVSLYIILDGTDYFDLRVADLGITVAK